MPPFELTGTYDEASLNAATRILFRRLWMWQLPMTAGAIIAVLGTALFLWYLRLRDLLWFFVAYPLIFPVLWMFSYWNIRRGLMKRLGKSVRFG